MTCDECKEQVLELIERETSDPEAVREVLARCPECRALFDEMKAGLALADRLPRLEPPDEVDAQILRAARARTRRAAPLRRRWFQSPEWAVAAVALLAVGVGVWAIPRGQQVEPTAGLAAPSDMDRMEERETSLDEADTAMAAEVALADRGGAQEPATPKASQKAPAKPALREARPQPARRRSKTDARRADAVAKTAPAPAAADPESLAASGAAADVAVAEQAESFRGDARTEKAEVSPECARRLARVERRNLDDDRAAVAPEDALAIGECYRAAGDLPNARLWLERASLDAETKERAMRALRELGPD